MKVAAIVPAYNEKGRIHVVLEAIKGASEVHEIVVVSDGSTDGTYELVSADTSLKVVRLEPNQGKGGAMRAGAMNTDADVILFLDADLVGMDAEKVNSLVRPVAQNRADMAIGVFKGGRRSTDLAQFLTPYISGQRAMRREEFLKIPRVDKVRSGVETAITKYYRAHNLRVERVTLTNCTHCMKEEKLGYARGLVARIKMYADIGKIMLDGRDFRK